MKIIFTNELIIDISRRKGHQIVTAVIEAPRLIYRQTRLDCNGTIFDETVSFLRNDLYEYNKSIK